MNKQPAREQEAYKSFIRYNVPLKDKNWFKTGGSAYAYAEPHTAQEFQDALLFAKANNLPLFVLGEGANVLISDMGFQGLIIQPHTRTLVHNQKTSDEVHVTAGSGIKIQELINWCLDNNIGGLEEFSGIPGTIGGAVYINLHYYEFLIEHFLVEATVIKKDTGNIYRVSKDWFNFGYNQSKLLEKEYYIIDATFTLKKISDIEVAYARGRRAEIIRHRVRRYPSANTCGSFFRNFHANEIDFEINNKKILFVAYYLDNVGVRGALSCGGATVSHMHANMLVTREHATSTDIIQLARAMQELVYNKFGIIPQPECQLIGFDEYPLL